MADLPEHVAENRRHWDKMADWWVRPGERAWDSGEPTWGIWMTPETDLRLFPTALDQKDAIELGCGTGYVSGWMARRGARVTGIDNSERQLSTARRLAAQHGVELTLIHGNAEAVPLPDESFDFAVSEYGAALWCDPRAWIPEAHRLLRPGGELTFLTTSSLAHVCMPGDGPLRDRLLRSTFDLHQLDWRSADEDPGGIEWNLCTSAWFALFKKTGFEVLDFVEVRAPEGAPENPFGIPPEWARLHPSEQVWKLRKQRGSARKS